MQVKRPLEDTLDLMRDLRTRCEWDAAQTHESLRPYLLEEALEVDEAIKSRDDRLLREELGDLLFQVLFHAVVAEERGTFTFDDVAATLIAKMRARHPHLFGDGAREPWESMKARKRESIVDGLPIGLPALHRAFRLQDRAAGVGFDWPDTAGPISKVNEELNEVRQELGNSRNGAGQNSANSSASKKSAGTDSVGDSASNDSHETAPSRLEGEIGDLLFAVVNLSRKAGVHPAVALDKANAKFARRFRGIEVRAKELGIALTEAGLEALDRMWDEEKRKERQQEQR
jgi:uncharacterized protein YabN with tetrapyrrole methylase and pyrophosphatase domain